MILTFSNFRQALCLIVAAFLVTSAACIAQRLTIYPVPSEIQRGKQFSVEVRVIGGQWKAVDTYAATVNVRQPSQASLAYFDFTGSVEVRVRYRNGPIHSVRIRPLSYSVVPQVELDSLTFVISQPRNISIEVNGDAYQNLHLFAGTPDDDPPDSDAQNVLYFGPGFHSLPETTRLQNGQTVYLAGGAVVETSFVCDHVHNVSIRGRGILYHSQDALRIDDSDHVTVQGITVLDPKHYSLIVGDSSEILVRDFKAFSSVTWGDGIDLFTSRHVLIDGVFLRNSDDTIAIYGHRWNYYGNSADITVENSTLWPDVAHPILVGTHGDFAKPEIIEDLTFRNIDVLQQDEPQIDYQGCFALNASDGNLIRHVRVDGLRIEAITMGQLVNLRVTYNKKYAQGPGRGIEDVVLRGLSYTGEHANISVIDGYDDERSIKNLVFVDLFINGRAISDHMQGKPNYFKTSDMADFFVGDHVDDVRFLTSAEERASHMTH